MSNKSYNLLLSKLKKGDKKAFEEIYVQFYRELCVYISNFTNNQLVVEDIVQDVLMKLWKNREDIQSQYSKSNGMILTCYPPRLRTLLRIRR